MGLACYRNENRKETLKDRNTSGCGARAFNVERSPHGGAASFFANFSASVSVSVKPGATGPAARAPVCRTRTAIGFDFPGRAAFLAFMAIATLNPPKARRRWTYDEMAAELPETNLPTELWDGELIMSAAPRPIHQIIVTNVSAVLNEHVKPRRLGRAIVSPIDVVFSGSKAMQPDVVFVSKARESIIVQNCIRGVPDLLVEVISEGTWRRDRVDKKALYEQFGVAEYWIIDPDSQLIEVFVLTSGTYRLHARGVGAEKVGSKLLTGLKVSFERLEE